MAMRLADTFLVHRRTCFAILFSGQTPHWSLPRFFGNAARLHCPMDQAYEYRTDVCNYCVCQLWVHTLAVKWLCDASRARAADDSIGGPQMLKFLNALAALAADLPGVPSRGVVFFLVIHKRTALLFKNPKSFFGGQAPICIFPHRIRQSMTSEVKRKCATTMTAPACG